MPDFSNEFYDSLNRDNHRYFLRLKIFHDNADLSDYEIVRKVLRFDQEFPDPNPYIPRSRYKPRQWDSKFSLQEAEQIREEYKRGGTTYHKLREKYKCSYETIVNIMNRRGAYKKTP